METGSVKEMIPVPAIGAAVGVIGSLQAVVTLKILLGLSVSYGTMLQYDGIYGEFEPIPVMLRPDCECQQFEVG
jgi:molybdopterin/thiamine biosynthesis adenylyltransferase